MNDTICSSGNTKITVSDPLLDTIIIKPIPNSFVNGAKDHSFNKTGIIDDKLINSSNIVQYQQYEVKSNRCTQIKDTIEIAILPIYTPRQTTKVLDICHKNTGVKQNTLDFNVIGDFRYGRWLNLSNAPVNTSN
jgi:hypothetical protein